MVRAVGDAQITVVHVTSPRVDIGPDESVPDQGEEAEVDVALAGGPEVVQTVEPAADPCPSLRASTLPIGPTT